MNLFHRLVEALERIASALERQYPPTPKPSVSPEPAEFHTGDEAAQYDEWAKEQHQRDLASE